MKKFVFKFEALEKKRAQIEKKRQGELSKVSALYNKEQVYKSQCLQTIKENIKYADNLDISDEDNMSIIMQTMNANFALRNRIKMHEGNMDKIKPELLKRQKILVEASKQKKAVEKLREKKYKEYKAYLLKEEQKNLDDYKVKKTDNIII